MKPEKASLHAPKVRFMARSAASYFCVLDTQRRARHKVLHKNAFSDEALFRFTSQYGASSFHSDMKHSTNAPYDEKTPLRRFVTETHIDFPLEISGN